LIDEINPKSAKVTYSPYTRKFYVGAVQGNDFAHESHLEPIAKVNFDKELGDGRYEYLNAELYRQAERHTLAGIVDSPSVSTITTVDLLQEVLGKQYRQFFAKAGTTSISVPKLQLDIPLSTKYAASKKVPELVEAQLKQEDFTKVSFNLEKHVVHIAASDEASLKANIEPFQHNIGQAAGSLAKAWNEDIVVAIEGHTGVSGADWGALTAAFSDTNPLDNIEAVYTTIINNDYVPDTITMAPRVWNDYTSNTFINGYDPATDRSLVGVFPFPKLPGIRAIVDPGFTNTVATVYDSRGMLFGEGPTVAEQYRNAAAGYNGWIIRQWGQPLLADAKSGRKLTGVSA
jgi:hypothetical protein